ARRAPPTTEPLSSTPVHSSRQHPKGRAVAIADVELPILVFDNDQATRSRLAMQLGERAEPIGSVDALSARLTGGAAVLVLGPSCASNEGLGGTEPVIGAHPEVGAILVATELSTDLLQ